MVAHTADGLDVARCTDQVAEIPAQVGHVDLDGSAIGIRDPGTGGLAPQFEDEGIWLRRSPAGSHAPGHGSW